MFLEYEMYRKTLDMGDKRKQQMNRFDVIEVPTYQLNNRSRNPKLAVIKSKTILF
jgi:hypothetical protein